MEIMMLEFSSRWKIIEKLIQGSSDRTLRHQWNFLLHGEIFVAAQEIFAIAR
jgi:hypothetical protein